MKTVNTGSYATSVSAIEEDSTALVTGGEVFRVLGGEKQAAWNVTFEPTGKLTADNVQDAIVQAASSGSGGTGLEILPWADWKDLTDNQRDEYKIVAVEGAPVAPYSVGQAYIDVGRTITKQEYQRLTPKQQNSGTWYVEGMGMVAQEISTIRTSLQFTDSEAIVNNDLIHTTSRIMVQPIGDQSLGKLLNVNVIDERSVTITGYDCISSTQLTDITLEAVLLIDNTQ